MVNFECHNCNFEQLYVDEPAPKNCPECDSRWYRLRFGMKRQENLVNIDGTSRGHKRYSTSLGCSPHEIEKFKKLYPGSEYTPDGRLVIKNRQHKKQEMKRRGYCELD